jgi:hypothetical protein
LDKFDRLWPQIVGERGKNQSSKRQKSQHEKGGLDQAELARGGLIVHFWIFCADVLPAWLLVSLAGIGVSCRRARSN